MATTSQHAPCRCRCQSMRMSLHLSLHMSAHIHIQLSIHISAHMSAHMSIPNCLSDQGHDVPAFANTALCQHYFMPTPLCANTTLCQLYFVRRNSFSFLWFQVRLLGLDELKATSVEGKATCGLHVPRSFAHYFCVAFQARQWTG